MALIIKLILHLIRVQISQLKPMNNNWKNLKLTDKEESYYKMNFV